jgi:microsomal dipeptidase-like Zn-dependent dipeptidase
MIVDLHAHFPMHLLPPEQRDTHAAVLAPWPGSRWRSVILEILSRLANYQGPRGGPGVTVELMRKGNVGAALSVLYAPFDEMDLSQPYAAPPLSRYVQSLRDQMALVEQDIAADPNADMARNPAEMDAAIAAGRVAMIHSVEGAFALGATEAEIAATVEEFAGRGVAYITIAHLFYRGVAQNSPALPFMPDALYKLVFPQKGDAGLTALGEAAIRAMVRHNVLVDVTHMNDKAIDHTFKVLDATGENPPLIASHIACRFKDTDYNLSDDAIKELARRGGVMGVIVCEHWANDGLPKAKAFDDSVKVIREHIDRVHGLTGSYDNIAIGSDLDGYIKPALPGLEHEGHMKALEDALVAGYGAAVAQQICSDNVLGLLRRYWRGA